MRGQVLRTSRVTSPRPNSCVTSPNSSDDRHEIFQCRGNSNKAGFALLLGGVRLTGRFPSNFELISLTLLAHVCAQLGIEGMLFLDYPQRQPTRYDHVERLKQYLGLRSFIADDHGHGNVRELQKIVSKAVGASLSPLVAGMEFRIAFERLTIDEKAVADAIEATMPCEVADGRADLAGKCVVKETWEQRELRHEEETKSQVLEALRVCDWNQAEAARELGMSRQAFWKQLKRNLPLRLISCGGRFRA
jgi:Domain of unknown function (DUF4158)/Bacterial regulatory protein, Fis family